ncbi:MAG: hypothetical protein C0594_06045, partial [Marinilabiliales bacterium]
MKLGLSLLVLLLSCSLFGQNQSRNWYFGNQAGFSFSSEDPVVLADGSMNAEEGCTAISDESGMLLFYTNGVSVWNRNHDLMVNGYGLMGDPLSSQSVLVVEKPLENDIYFVFTMDQSGGQDGLRYSIIDMNEGGGLGAVITKNALVESPVTSKIAAVKHANGTDVWIVVHGWNNNSLYAYLLTPNTFDLPVVSSLGNLYGSAGSVGTNGYMKFSPDKNFMAMADSYSGIIELFRFDNQTGAFSDPIALTGYEGVYGLEFSNKSNMLYVSNMDTYEILQFDISDYNSYKIKNSEQLVGVSQMQPGALQLAPDGRIYLARNNSETIGVICNPEAQGTFCAFLQAAVNLNSGMSKLGLPSYEQIFDQSFSFYHTCFGDTTWFVVDNSEFVDSVYWHFNDHETGEENTAEGLSSYHVFSAPGKYTVELIVYSAGTYSVENRLVEIFPYPGTSIAFEDPL